MNKAILFMVIVAIIIMGWFIIDFVKKNSFVDLFALGFVLISMFWFGGLGLYLMNKNKDG